MAVILNGALLCTVRGRISSQSLRSFYFSYNLIDRRVRFAHAIDQHNGDVTCHYDIQSLESCFGSGLGSKT
jgi:hypothetical protein